MSLVYREGTDKMGIAGCYHPFDYALMGQELHGIDGLLPRLRADVCQVPYGGLDIGYR